MSLRVARQIVVDRGLRTERRMAQSGIATLGTPLVILGEPGLGKSTLCEDLAQAPGFVMVSATKFLLAGAAVPSGATLIIDGLDEASSSTPGAAVDAALAKLAALGWPSFVLSCRSIDWRGAVDRYKLRQAYDRDPVVLYLEPLSRAEANTLLEAWFPMIGATDVLDRLDAKGLADIYGNPLSLKLLGEAVRAGQLPETRAAILEAASLALLREENDAHKASSAALAAPDRLLNGAGAIAAILILSGKSGTYLGAHADTPELYVAKSDLTTFAPVADIDDALTTRLFRSDGESRIVPIHRVVAEYLGARWLAQRIKPDRSPRRLLQLLQFQGGVPTPLRGLHAWLAHFSDRLAEAVIAADPFGVVRYGDAEGFSVPQARILLQALSKLADDDPYFRAEDWSERRIAALASPALHADMLAILRAPQRSHHLSLFVLQAIAGSQLATTLQQDLEQIVLDCDAVYAERSAAGDSLIANGATDWPVLVRKLLTQGTYDSARLAVEAITNLKGQNFLPDDIVEAAFQSAGLTVNAWPRKHEDENRHVVGVAYLLAEAVPLDRLAQVLDEAETYAAPLYADAEWEVQWTTREFLETAILRALHADGTLTGERVWRWIHYLHRGAEGPGRGKKIAQHLEEHPALRRAIQAAAFADEKAAESLWMRAHALAKTGFGLYPAEEDTLTFLKALAEKPALTSADKEDWKDLIRVARTRAGLSPAILAVAKPVADQDPDLATFLHDYADVRVPEWERQQEERRRARAEEKARGFATARANYSAHLAEIGAGDIGWLVNPAKAYLGLFNDLPREAEPMARLTAWLGPQLAKAVQQGFVVALSNAGLPSAEAIGKAHADDKEYGAEYLIIAGIAEWLLQGKDLSALPPPTLLAGWMSWQKSGGWLTNTLKQDIGPPLNAVLFADATALHHALTLEIDPQVAAGRAHIDGLYAAIHEPDRRAVFWPMAYDWLKAARPVPLPVETQLLDCVLQNASVQDCATLVRLRLADGTMLPEQRSLWLSAAFLADFATWHSEFVKAAKDDRNFLWAIRARVSRDSWSVGDLAPAQLHFIVQAFGAAWPPSESPGSGVGDTNPWDATRLINNAITRLGSIATPESATVLGQLSTLPGSGYGELIRHISAQQRQLQRDTVYTPASLAEVKTVLTGGIPTTLDDLKAYVLDHLDALQAYVRGSDVRTRQMFYASGEPLIENDCRDRLIDLLRPRMSDGILLMPEVQMPESKRVDIDVIRDRMGLPIEIKGQWHKHLWDAPAGQLDSLYARDWRADGYGVFLALWFGGAVSKRLTPSPDGIRPATPDALKAMLEARIPSERRAKIAVFVLDLT